MKNQSSKITESKKGSVIAASPNLSKKISLNDPDNSIRLLAETILEESILKDASAMIRRRKQLQVKELNYKPVQLLEDHTRKEMDFLNGFDIIPFWDFANKISLVNIAFKALEANAMSNNADPSHIENTRLEVLELIQHIGFFSEFIVNRRDEVALYLQEVEAANSES